MTGGHQSPHKQGHFADSTITAHHNSDRPRP